MTTKTKQIREPNRNCIFYFFLTELGGSTIGRSGSFNRATINSNSNLPILNQIKSTTSNTIHGHDQSPPDLQFLSGGN